RVRGPARLCGYSMGGRVAIELLVRRPELFESAVIIAAQPGLEHEAPRAERAASDARWCELAEREGAAAFCAAWEAQPLFLSQTRLPAHVQATQRERRSRHTGHALSIAMRTFGLATMPNYWPLLPEIRVP